jgi:DNA-binding NarL/FixJ family response regulator
VAITVLIADDHVQFRAMVAETLEAAGFTVCAQAGTGDAATRLAVEHTPDVCLLDIQMPGDGIAAARRIAAALPATRILMLTVSAESDDVLDALQAGADGYIVKGAAPHEISRAVRAVFAGEVVIAPTVTPALVQEVRRSRTRRLRTASGTSLQLTEREWEILQLLDDGRTTSQIAKALFVAPVTIRTHIAAVVRKLEVDDRDEALALFRRQTTSDGTAGGTPGVER